MWKLNDGFLSAQPLQVAVVGVGGTGSAIVSNLIHLHLGLQALGYGGLHVVAFDPDYVSTSNVVRQRYTMNDVGRNKAEVLIQRCNMAAALHWEAVPTRFLTKYGRRTWDLVISCVDTRSARKQLHRMAFGDGITCWKYWMDCGNDATTGQVILGTPRGSQRALAYALPSATELHPEIMDDTIPDDDAPSCSALESLRRQDLMVNQACALYATDLLWRLFNEREIASHGRYFDLKNGALAPLPVPQKPRRKRAA